MRRALLALAATATALGGLTVTAPGAMAKESPTVYVHGGSSSVTFTSRAACNTQAAAAVAKVRSQPRQARLLGETRYFGYGDRLTCYPVHTGRWTYLVAYEALSNRALWQGDRAYPRFGSAAVDGERIWGREHAPSFTSKKDCDAHFAWAVKAIRANPSTKINYDTRPCMNSIEDRYDYRVSYLATSPTAGFAGDATYDEVISILNQTGWAVPYGPTR